MTPTLGSWLWDSPGIGVAVWDGRCRYVAINDELARLNGRTPEEHVGRLPVDVVGQPFAEPLTALVQEVLRSGDVIGLELSDADHVWETVWLRRGTGDDVRVVCVAVDVTAQRAPAVGDVPASRSAAWTSRLLAAVVALADTATTPTSLSQALADVVSSLGAGSAAVGLVEDGSLVFPADLESAASGGPPRLDGASDDPEARAVRTGLPVWVPGGPGEPGEQGAPGGRARAALPLRGVTGDVLGVLRLVWDQPQEFGVTQRTFLEAAAGHVARAVARLLLSQSEQRAREEASAARERSARLLSLAQQLNGTTTTDEVARTLWTALLPVGAVGGGIGLLDRDAGLMRIAAVWGGVAWPDVPLTSDLPFVHAALRTRWTTVARDELEATNPAAAQWMREVGSRTALALPLVDRGRTVGSLSVHLAATALDDTEREYLQTVAALTAQALARAAAQERAHASLVRLQHALLPVRLDRTDCVRASAGFRASRLAGEVGGDFYDVVALPDGGAVLLLGDVEGHDLDASAVMGQLRAVLRAHALEGLSPLEVLTRADAFLSDLPAGRLATVVVAEVRPDSRLLVLSSAGHLPGVLLGPRPRLLDVTADPPLGLGPVRRHERLLPLEDHSRLLFFTDGLVETRDRDIDDDLAGLLTDLERLGGLPDEDLVRELLSSAGSDTGDDAAVLLVDVRPLQEPASDVRERRLPPSRRNVHLSRHWARGVWRDWDVGEEAAGVLDLVLAELLSNAVRVADTDVCLRLRREPGTLVVEVSDDSPREPRVTAGAGAGAEQTWGRGLSIVDALSAGWGVDWHGDAGKTVWARVGA